MVFGKHVNRYYFKYSPLLLLGVLALLLVDYFQLKIPELYKMVINGANNGVVEIDGVLRDFDMTFVLDEICLPMIIIIFAMVIGRFLWRVSFYGASIRVERDLRFRMFEHSKGLSQEFYQKNKVGDLMSLFTNDLETIHESFGNGILMFFDALLLGVLAFVKMIRMSPMLTLFSMIPMVLLFIVSTIVGKYMMKKWATRQAAFSKISDFAQESFSGISVVKAFAKEAYELWRFKKLNKENENANIVYTRASTLLHIFVILFVESVVCIILGYGGYLVYKDVFNAGELIEFISYFQSIVWPIMAISQLIEMSSRAKASLNRISKLLDEKPSVVDEKVARDVESISGDIELCSLTFKYPGARDYVLKDISFKINAGESIGIIGRTGSGKTTIVDLMLRTYNIPRGMLFFDGIDVNDITIESLRRGIAYVPQDNFLFSDTIENNIGFAKDSFELGEVKNAAVLASVHENISEFSEGYKTVLGERGVTVSGGQKQRISIARALMKNASVLILDDSVSAVDTDTEREILENLHKTRKGKTTILIAHRISTVSGMDKIIFIDNGELVDVGNHAELMARCPKYRRTVELQRLEDEAK